MTNISKIHRLLIQFTYTRLRHITFCHIFTHWYFIYNYHITVDLIMMDKDVCCITTSLLIVDVDFATQVATLTRLKSHVTRGTTTAKKLRGNKVWVPSLGFLHPVPGQPKAGLGVG